jgi:hypothetical protein
MNYKAFFFSRYNINVLIIVLLLVNFCFGQLANAAEAFQIKGYYLGATPAELGITVDSDFDQEEQSYEVVGAGNVSLFFVRVGDKLRVYRILPEMQHIEASYFKASPKIMKYTLSATNRASWNITESQEFIAWIEQGRILYELLDHEPQKVKTVPKPAPTAEGEEPVGDKPEGDGWETDF